MIEGQLELVAPMERLVTVVTQGCRVPRETKEGRERGGQEGLMVEMETLVSLVHLVKEERRETQERGGWRV